MPSRLSTAVLRILFAALLFTTSARATWSIVVLNQRTGEVCVASATCINAFDLQRAIAVVRVGVGAACAQSVVDSSGANRMLIWNELQVGTPPDQILAALAAQDTQHQRRQYGIVSFSGGAASFTGSLCGAARAGVSGQSGDYLYAIQGNLLAGTAIVDAAESAFLAASGDTATRVMAAMMAARDLGGDGRCSCSTLLPSSCALPPPGFTLADRTAFLLCARMGDTDGVCNGTVGCANGSYWCDLRVTTPSAAGTDPVIVVNNWFADWRGGMADTADQLLTAVWPGAQSIPADGRTSVTVDVQLRNVDGGDVVSSPAQLLVESLDPGLEPAVASVPVDDGSGRFHFTLTSNGNVGPGHWRLTVVHPWKTVRLWPDLELRGDALQPLHCGYDVVGASEGAAVPLTLNLGAAQVGARYLVLGTSSGTSPGVVFGDQHLPLNRDSFLMQSLTHAGAPPYVGTSGALDVNGSAACAYVALPGALAPLVGRHVDWAALVRGSFVGVTNVAGFDVAP